MSKKPTFEAPQGTPSIWCLFSIDNNYDQPDHNLITWWREKPSIEALAKEPTQ